MESASIQPEFPFKKNPLNGFFESASAQLFNTSIGQLNNQEVRLFANSLLEKISLDAKQIELQQQQVEQQKQQIEKDTQELKNRQNMIDALVYEIAYLKGKRFAAKTEHLKNIQLQLFEEALNEDLAAAEQKLADLDSKKTPSPSTAKKKPKRRPLPADLPRVTIKHEPKNTQCGCGHELERIGQDVSERLDYIPGKFQVEQHVRGVWTCSCCQKMKQQPMPAHIIDGGIPTSRLLAQVICAKYEQHLPLYRQSQIYAKQGVDLPISTLADWVGTTGVQVAPLVDALKIECLQSKVMHADETPIVILNPKGKTKRGYIWAYTSGEHEQSKIVIYDLQSTRGGQHPKQFLQHQRHPTDPDPLPWLGHLVVDDYSGYKPLFNTYADLIEVGCWAHVRRKFFDLHQSTKSPMAAQALHSIGQLYLIERHIKEQNLNAEQTWLERQTHAKPIIKALHLWMMTQHTKATPNGASAKALNYAIKRWTALSVYLDNPAAPIDNNRIENLIRSLALGRKNWLFAGSEKAGQRAAGLMSLIQTAKLNGLDPQAYLQDVFERLPTHPNSRISELLPTHWQPQV